VLGKTIRRLGVIANCTKPRAAEVLGRLRAKAKALGLEVLAEGEAARALRTGRRPKPGAMFRRIDALVALGGDGTMLRAVRELNGPDIPVLGVNIGALGFLTSVAEADLERALECLVAGYYTTSVRSIADCRGRRGGRTLRYRALNDVVLTQDGPARVVTLDLSIDGEPVSSVVCDGLIVSTPTGSTGHSLSAGGPVVAPASPVFVVTMICPHTLSTRPLVVPDQSAIGVRVTNSPGGVVLSVDGQVGNPLSAGDAIEVRRSPQSVRFVHLPRYSYFSVLRQKLHWRGSNV
jgi:NAD+ kinase